MARNTRRLLSLFAVVGAGALIAAPAAVADRYVDDSGNDASTCNVPAMPCLTINKAIMEAGAGETVFIGGGGPYPAVFVDKNVSLIESNFNPPATMGQALVDGGASNGIQVDTAAGTIRGLTIRGTPRPLLVDGPVTVDSNLFDDPDLNNQASVFITSDGGSSVITGNTVLDSTPDDSSDLGGIEFSGNGSPLITGNILTGAEFGISVSNPTMTAGAAQVTGNTVTGLSTDGGTTCGICADGNLTATFTANHVHSPGAMGERNAFTVLTDANLVMRRNRAFNHTHGLRIGGTGTGMVTLDGDVLAKSIGPNIFATDQVAGGTEGDFTATNVTVVDGTGDEAIRLEDINAEIDLSIVGAEGIDNAMGASACAITNSNLVPGGTPDGAMTCAPAQFTFNLNPGFVNPGMNDYHLLASSPLIDIGNPTASVSLDLDGQPRVQDGNCDGVARRDIGADEFSVTCPGPATPTPTPTPTPLAPAATTPTKKKCKKGRKLKKGKCVKKKRKRK